jgi:hypothetical protein
MSPKHLLRYGSSLVLIIAIWATWHLGFRLGSHPDRTLASSPSSPSQASIEISEKEISEKKTPPSGLLHLSGENPQNLHDSYSLYDEKFNHFISKNHLELKVQELSTCFSNTPHGHALARIAALSRYARIIRSEEATYLNEQLNFINSRPEASIEDLKKNISKLGPQFSEERRFLITIVGKMNLGVEAKIDFLSDQLIQSPPVYDIQDPNSAQGTTALHTLIQITKDPRMIEPALHKTLSQLTDPNAKEKLLLIYGNQYPDQALKLRREFGMMK